MMHINGVTELNIIDVYQTPWWLSLSLLITAVCAITLIVILGNLQSPRSSTILILGIIIILLILIIAGLGITHSFGWLDEYSYTKYEILANDNVNINEFNKTYEIIEQRGQIYVVKFKEP